MEITSRLQSKISRGIILAGLTGVMAISLAACGGEATPTPQAAAPTVPAVGATSNTPAASDTTPAAAGAATGTQTIKATETEWSITLSPSEVNAGTVQITATNDGKFTHDLVIQDSNGKVAATPKFKSSDGAQTISADLKAGTYTVLCDVTGHADRGMKTQLVVK